MAASTPSKSNSTSSTRPSCRPSFTAMLVSLCLFLCLAALYTENLNLCAVNSLSLSPLQVKTNDTITAVTTVTASSAAVSEKKKRKIPSFANGGVVIFYHSPKTGGMSVRHNFDSIYQIQHKMLGYNGKTLQSHATVIDGFLTRKRKDRMDKNSTVLFLELHGPTPGVLQLYTELARWRRLAVQHDTGFFAWTLIREPVAFSVSYFNFFWSEPCLFPTGCPYKLYDATEDNLKFTAKADQQCLYWSRSDVTWRSFKNHGDRIDNDNTNADGSTSMSRSSSLLPAWPVATETECAAVQEILLQEMDWVGTTEKLSTETLPLLAYMLSISLQQQDTAADAAATDNNDNDDENGKNDLQVFNSVAAQKDAVVTVKSLLPSTVDYIKSINTYDQTIYEAVQREFTMDMWEDWIVD